MEFISDCMNPPHPASVLEIDEQIGLGPYMTYYVTKSLFRLLPLRHSQKVSENDYGALM